MLTTTAKFIVALTGDGTTAKISLALASSPAFATSTTLDNPRLQRPNAVAIDEVTAGPGHYRPQLVERQHTHRPMIDGEVEVAVAQVNARGETVHNEDGSTKLVTVRVPRRIEGPEITETILELGPAPELPMVDAEILSNGVLLLSFDPPIEAGAELGIAGTFTYHLGEST